MTEEERAAAYRAQEVARVAWEEQNELRLAGSAIAKTALQERWEPLLAFLRERRFI